MAEASKDSASYFATAILPLYHGPLVKINIKPSNHEYTISKRLLCEESPVFSAMFEGQFKESQEMIADLEEMEGVISVRSVQTLIQWLYLRVVNFHIEDPGEHITAAMELVRLADKYNIAGLETKMAQYIKEIIIANPHPEANDLLPPVNPNTYWIDREHIISATYLRREHPVRQTLAAASVAGYLRSHDYKFSEETQEYPSFGADLLLEVGSALDRPRSMPAGNFEDPISGKILELDRGSPDLL
ncbi:hypothetical protein N7492_009833 [Penicillium capsulatum]|uniref:BTB domain-containing protein n=1 Tax=Penicillium capsulatum TaxID=69766 RepID=A0A9W9LEL5_9EURO|nr:hypothetical protein N7492_009833 [Penicillium capsulatum]KAJ6112344.1 hypothetical protein N7512_007668 [Penicillium capsulatum]